MTMSPRVVFFGNERLVSGLKHTDAPILRGLLAHGYNVVAVVASHHDATSRLARRLEVADIAAAHNVPVFLPDKPGDIIQELRDLSPDLGILVAYGRIIPQRIIDVFSPIGIINIHPSLLPRHRGSTPIESTILAGDDHAGVSIMQLTAGMDEGPVYAHWSYKLTGNETKFDIHETLSREAAGLLFSLLPDIVSGKLSPLSQRTTDVTYTTHITKSDGRINPQTDTAHTVSRKVRAYLGFPKTTLSYKGNDVILASAKPIDSPISGELCISCAQNTTLLVESLIAPSGKTMSGSAYMRGLVNRAKER